MNKLWKYSFWFWVALKIKKNKRKLKIKTIIEFIYQTYFLFGMIRSKRKKLKLWKINCIYLIMFSFIYVNFAITHICKNIKKKIKLINEKHEI